MDNYNEWTFRKVIFIVALLILLIFVLSNIIKLVIEGRDTTEFCINKGYKYASELHTINDIEYIKCCGNIVTETDFERACKIFRRD